MSVLSGLCPSPIEIGDATVDEVAIFSVALEEADIQQMYDQGLEFAVLAVEPADKMTTTWANVKVKY